ncbi:MAG: arsenate reductase ArsC [Nitrospirota bacterium]
MTEVKKLKVMFLCTGNSCRSQMAEGFARALGKGLIEAHSAGLMKCYVHPKAIAVMREVDIDISGHQSKYIDETLLKQMDIIVTLCSHANSSCPVTPPGIKKIHTPVNDPVGASGTEEEIMEAFRKARDEIKAKVETLIDLLKRNSI